MSYQWKDKVVLITGVASGIGAEVVKFVVKECDKTVLVTGTLKALEMMRKDRGGRGGTVINISSIAGLIQNEVMPIYYATKSAVLQFSNCIGHENYYSRTGVRVLTICFGATSTPLLTPMKLGYIDPSLEAEMNIQLDKYPSQLPVSAAKGLADAFKNGKSGSTWLVDADKPAQDISSDIQIAYGIMSSKMAVC